MLMPVVGTALRHEWTTTPSDPQPAALKHGCEHSVVEQQELTLMQLKSNMAIPEVISRLQQRQRK